eukprot:Polyplicarium_translucidae@DN1431_c0_g1_i1.p1
MTTTAAVTRRDSVPDSTEKPAGKYVPPHRRGAGQRAEEPAQPPPPTSGHATLQGDANGPPIRASGGPRNLDALRSLPSSVGTRPGGRDRERDSRRPATAVPRRGVAEWDVQSVATGPIRSTWDRRGERSMQREAEADVFRTDDDSRMKINFEPYAQIPVELSGKEAQTIQPFESFADSNNIHPLLQKNVTRMGYESPTPVQKYSVPSVLSRRDLMACAQTGSGKTAAFLFPIVTRMLEDGPPTEQGGGYRYAAASPVCLVLSPTRELAQQIHGEARKFCFATGVRACVVYGGGRASDQYRSLRLGCDILVATPGRLLDFLQRGSVNQSSVQYLVLDEADRMLDMGFEIQIRQIVEDFNLPSSAQGRQTVMFSATFPLDIQKLASDFLRDYLFLTVGRVGSTHENITQKVVYCEDHDKIHQLSKIIRDAPPKHKILVFVETKRKVDEISTILQSHRIECGSIHGDRNQAEREEALKMFRAGHRDVLIATDVAARGLDIANVSHVINFDLPAMIEDYVHRIGRTGRAGNSGVATSFVDSKCRDHFLRELLGLFRETSQETPSWFVRKVDQTSSAARSGRGGAFRGGRGGGAARFGPSSRDMRSHHDEDRRHYDRGGAGRWRDFGGDSARIQDYDDDKDAGW